MGNETLKKLAQDYAIGQIDRHNYRQQRARLIDEITGYKDSPQSSSATAQSDDIANQPLAGSSGLSTSSFKAKVVLIAAVVIAIIIVAIFLANNGDNNNKQANTTSQLTPHKAETLVSTFINYDDWTSETKSGNKGLNGAAFYAIY